MTWGVPVLGSLGLATGLFAQSGGTLWLPEARSTTASAVDDVFRLVLYISAFFFVLIVAVMVVFVIRYRRRPGVEAQKTATHSLPLEATWSIIPILIVIYIFYRGFVGYIDMRTPPVDAYGIQVVAKQWKWFFKYGNGHVDEELHVPVDRPVRLTMRSEDVIHSLFVPKFRIKMDVVPGRYTSAWFQATEPGSYDLLCAEYCGARGSEGHSDMVTKVIVHPPGEFEKWLEEEGNLLKSMSPVEAGEQLVRTRGCLQCHSTDGSARVGPSFKGIWGQTHRFTDGTTAVVDENYIRESILYPQKKIREGYPAQMSTYQGLLSDDDISAIIQYIKSLK